MANVKQYSKKESGGVQLTPNFKVREFACKDGNDKVLIDLELLSLLQLVRDIMGEPFYINSGYRTEKHNRKVGGAPNSFHLYGRAFDVGCSDLRRFAWLCNRIGVRGILHYSTFTHIDSRDTIYHANYSNEKFDWGYDPVPYQGKLLYQGLTHYLVGVLQFRLNILGYNCGTADWIFGNKTKNAVIRFQQDRGCQVDGIVGSETWAKLFL